MFVLQLHPFLKKIKFTNSAGDDISFHESRDRMAQYDVQNIGNFPGGLQLLVKIGEFSSKSPHDQVLVISEEMIEWPLAFKEVRFCIDVEHILDDLNRLLRQD